MPVLPHSLYYICVLAVTLPVDLKWGVSWSFPRCAAVVLQSLSGLVVSWLCVSAAVCEETTVRLCQCWRQRQDQH